MNEIMDRIAGEIQKLDFSLNALLKEGNVRIISNEDMILWIVMGCIGLLCCFFGLKLIRVCGLVTGMAAGVEIGYRISDLVGLDSSYIWMMALGAGLFLAVLLTMFRKAAIFATVLCAVYSIGFFIVGPGSDLVTRLIPVAIALLAALIALRFQEVPILFVTGIYGAAVLGNLTQNIASHMGVRGWWVRPLAYVAWAALGILVQLLFESGRRKRKHLAQAEKIKNTYSVANDVERARLFVDRDGDDVSDEDEEETSEEVDKQIRKVSDLEFVSLDDEEYELDPEEDEEGLEDEEDPEEAEEGLEDGEDSEEHKEGSEEKEEDPQEHEGEQDGSSDSSDKEE